MFREATAPLRERSKREPCPCADPPDPRAMIPSSRPADPQLIPQFYHRYPPRPTSRGLAAAGPRARPAGPAPGYRPGTRSTGDTPGPCSPLPDDRPSRCWGGRSSIPRSWSAGLTVRASRPDPRSAPTPPVPRCSGQNRSGPSLPFPLPPPPTDSLPSGQAWATSSFRPLLPRKLGRDASRGGASRGRLPLCFPFASLGLICQPQHHASPLARPIPARKCPGPPSRQAIGTAGLSA